MSKVSVIITLFLAVAFIGCGGSKIYISSDYIINEKKKAFFGQKIAEVYYSVRKGAVLAEDATYDQMYLIQSFKYKGYNKSMLKIDYREYYVKDYSAYIKPDFSDTFEYDITLPDTIQLGKIKMLVHKADNKMIEYTVLDDHGLVDSLRVIYKSVKDFPQQ